MFGFYDHMRMSHQPDRATIPIIIVSITRTTFCTKTLKTLVSILNTNQGAYAPVVRLPCECYDDGKLFFVLFTLRTR